MSSGVEGMLPLLHYGSSFQEGDNRGCLVTHRQKTSSESSGFSSRFNHMLTIHILALSLIHI